MRVEGVRDGGWRLSEAERGNGLEGGGGRAEEEGWAEEVCGEALLDIVRGDGANGAELCGELRGRMAREGADLP